MGRGGRSPFLRGSTGGRGFGGGAEAHGKAGRERDSIPFFPSIVQVIGSPNAGLPNAFGQYDQTPAEMQALIKEYLQDNLINIIGGCCGTTPEHIKAIAEVAAQFKPRKSELAAI